MKKKWSTGKIVRVILGAIAAVNVLWIAFVISVYQLVDFFDKISESDGSYDKSYYDYGYDYEHGYDHGYNDDDDFEDYDYYLYRDEDDHYHSRDPYVYDDHDHWDDDYYDFENAIREDLSYQVEIRSYQKDDFITGEGKGYISYSMEYPVVSGDIPNLKAINQAIYEEVRSVEEYVSSASEILSEEEIYEYMGTGYVTYMSEDILSIAYVEYGYWNDSFLESYVISMNFDMQTGMILNNTNLLDINDSFSVDFRERCERQNGEIDDFNYMSDQEITDYLTDGDYLIIFYTPLGMEVGFNYYSGWVTVTYKDYERYRTQF